MEKKANELFQMYVRLYYDFAHTSVYFNDTDDQGFNACYLVKKNMENEKNVDACTWDAIHIVICNMKAAPKVSYKVISTALLSLDLTSQAVGKLSITGSSSKQISETVTLPADLGTSTGTDPDMFHISTIGRLIEQNEGNLRADVTEIYVNKQRHITNTGRLMEEWMTQDEKLKF